MAIFNSYVKLPEGIWHQCGCLIHQKDGIIPPWRSVTWVHRWRQVDGIKCTTGDTSTKKGHILSHGATPVAGWLCMLFHGKKPICYKWDDDDLGVPLWLRKPPYVSSATDETEWRWYQHVNGLETWNWTGTLTRALWGVASAHPNRTQWSSACMHTLCQPFRVLTRVTYPLSGHTIHYTKIYHIISIIQVSSTSLSDFECMFLPSCFFLKYFFLIFSNDLNPTYVITPTPLAHFDPGTESRDRVPAPMLCSQRRSWIWQMIRPSEIGIIVYIYIP